MKKSLLLIGQLVLVVFLLLSTVSCGGTSGNVSPTGPSQIPTGTIPMGELELADIVLKSSDLLDIDALIIDTFLPTLLDDGNESTNCQVESNNTTATGQCLTPINMEGKVSAISLGADNTIPYRLFGSTIGSISLDRNGELEVAAFNLANPVSISGTSNLADNEDKETQWNLLSAHMAYLDVKVQIKQQFWTLRMMFMASEPSSETSLTECVDEFYLQSIQSTGNLFSSNLGLKIGDLLLCKKTGETEVCADSDFQWLNLANDSLTSTRPDNPLQHDWVSQLQATCTDNSPGYDISLGGYDLAATIQTPFKLSAVTNECLQTFTYTDPNSSEVTTGNTLNATFDFNMTNTVFLNDITTTQLSTLSDAAILKAFTITQIQKRLQQEDPSGVSTDSISLGVTANISLTDDSTKTCSTDDIDSSFLLGANCTPDAEIKTTCTHSSCEHIGYSQISGSIWSQGSSGSSCTNYCVRQSCEEYQGETRTIYCIPECN